MEIIGTNKDAGNINEIRTALLKDGKVKVYHRPFGFGFSNLNWLRSALADIPCEIRVISYSPCGWTRPNALLIELND